MSIKVNIEKAGYPGRRVLGRLNLEIGGGEAVMIAGQSGSGKTTLLLSLLGVIEFLGGFVEGDIDIYGLNPLREEERGVLPNITGIVLQDPERQLIFPRVIDEISITLEALRGSVDRGEVEEILDLTGLKNREHLHVEDLSSGERKRLAIALSTIHKPPVLIIDEPSANLDPQGISLVRELIRGQKKRGGVVLLTEHKVSYFRDLVDEIYVLGKGSLVKSSVEEELSVLMKKCEEEQGSRGELLLKTRSLDIGFHGEVLLRDVDIEVRRGEVVVLIGPNGSGKTTLLKTITGFLKPLGGEISMYTRRVFYAPQNPDLVFIEPSVRRELVSLSKKTHIPVYEYISMYPWLSEVLDSSPFHLSHGQRRILEFTIARSHGEDLLVLDEPTTGLDPGIYVNLVKSIKQHTRSGGGVLIATHDPRLVLDVASRVYEVSNGGVREVDKCRSVYDMIRGAGIELL